MFLSGRLHVPLAQVDDDGWQRALDRHGFWRERGESPDAEHQDIAFHVLINEGELAEGAAAPRPAEGIEFDAVPLPAPAFDDAELCTLAREWAHMHAQNFGAGLVVKMGWYVIRSQGVLGYHVDGPIFLKGQRVDLSLPYIQRGLVEVNASRRTILPLRFNEQDSFMLCNYRAPLKAGELFEFSNVLPHAYFNRGPEHAVLLVTTYLCEDLLPMEFSYAPAREPQP